MLGHMDRKEKDISSPSKGTEMRVLSGSLLVGWTCSIPNGTLPEPTVPERQPKWAVWDWTGARVATPSRGQRC